METFSTLVALYAGYSPVTGEFPSQRPVTRSFDVFFDLRLNKRLSTQSKRWSFETSWCSLWRHCNGKCPCRTFYRNCELVTLLTEWEAGTLELLILESPWWRHQMEIFSALLAICAGNSPLPGEFPAQRPVTPSFDVFFDLRLNKRLSEQH